MLYSRPIPDQPSWARWRDNIGRSLTTLAFGTAAHSRELTRRNRRSACVGETTASRMPSRMALRTSRLSAIGPRSAAPNDDPLAGLSSSDTGMPSSTTRGVPRPTPGHRSAPGGALIARSLFFGLRINSADGRHLLQIAFAHCRNIRRLCQVAPPSRTSARRRRQYAFPHHPAIRTCTTLRTRRHSLM
jgi:hypothetical protein